VDAEKAGGGEEGQPGGTLRGVAGVWENEAELGGAEAVVGAGSGVQRTNSRLFSGMLHMVQGDVLRLNVLGPWRNDSLARRGTAVRSRGRWGVSERGLNHCSCNNRPVFSRGSEATGSFQARAQGVLLACLVTIWECFVPARILSPDAGLGWPMAASDQS